MGDWLIAESLYGDITEVKFDDGNSVTVNEAIQLAKEDKITNMNVGGTKDGKETLRSDRDDNISNNLDSLPSF